MKLCLKCLSLWNSEAEFCGKCRRSLGKKCPKGHVNAFISPAVTCSTCNEGPLDGVPFLRLSGLGPLISLVVLVFTFRYVWDHHCQAIHLMLRVLLWGIATLFDTTPRRVLQECYGVVNLWIAALLLSLFLPKATGTRVRSVLFQLPVRFAHMIRIAIRVTWRIIKRQTITNKPKAAQAKASKNQAESD